MKRIVTLLLAVLLLAALGVSASADEVWDYEEMGIRLHNTERLDECAGLANFDPYGVITRDPDAYYMPMSYYALSAEEVDELSSKPESAFTEEDYAKIDRAATLLGLVLVSRAEAEELTELLGLETQAGPVTLERFGGAEDLNFYCFFDDVENYRGNIGDDWAEDYVKAQEIVRQLLEEAELYAPADPEAAVVGRVISFETTDLDGNPVSSEELFAENEITMINYWGTWCTYCVQEMDDLAQIHRHLQKKGCGIVGILQDADSEESLQLARHILAENGVLYPNVKLSDDMDFAEEVAGFPTSYFVDRDGVVLCPAITGAAPSRYEATVDRLLSRETPEPEAAPAAAENGEDAYRVIVTDDEGEAIEGVALRFCDDATCTMGKTDAEGVARFELPEGTEYSVHVLKTPEGFEKNDEEYLTLTSYCDVTIVLKRAA